MSSEPPHGPGFADNRVLGGRIILRQPVSGFRSGSDAVLLAAACHPPQGGRVVELGCGTGSPMLCLAWRRPDIHFTGVEIDPATTRLAAYNIARNGMSRRGRAICGDVGRPVLTAGGTDLVLANPPYFVEGRHRRSPDPERDRARAEGAAPLAAWVRTAVGLLNPQGVAVFIMRSERRSDVQQALPPGWSMTERPVVGSLHKPPKRFLALLRAGGSHSVLPPIHLHDADGAETHLAGTIFRDAAPIFWPAPVASTRSGDT